MEIQDPVVRKDNCIERLPLSACRALQPYGKIAQRRLDCFLAHGGMDEMYLFYVDETGDCPDWTLEGVRQSNQAASAYAVLQVWNL